MIEDVQFELRQSRDLVQDLFKQNKALHQRLEEVCANKERIERGAIEARGEHKIREEKEQSCYHLIFLFLFL